jgi:hypothetical protein
MKNLSLLIATLLMIGNALFAQVGINTDGSAPDNSAMLDVKSSEKGILIPRMTLAERNAIATPATGLMIYQTDDTPGFYYNSGLPGSPLWTIIGGGTGSGWSLTGNSGSSSATNFIGTTDDVPLSFRVNNQKAGKIDHVLFNTSLGFQSMNSIISGYNNTATGFGALYANQMGCLNTATGSEALNSNTHGNYNTANGVQALFKNTSGNKNTAIGYGALFSNTTKSNLVAVGDSALFNNGVGVTSVNQAVDNTAVGSKALYANTTGSYNTAGGKFSLFSNTTGTDNTATGFKALMSYTEGALNTANGSKALMSNTTGSGNVATGFEALSHNTSGSSNTAIGNFALQSNFANSRSTAIGSYAMMFADNRNTSGSETYNTAIGYKALSGNWPAADNIGRYNTAVGDEAMASNSAGTENTASGASALFSNTTGSYNTAIGSLALKDNKEGQSNSAVGWSALYSNTSGVNNTGIGNRALWHNETGGGNTAVGYWALDNNPNGNHNTAIGCEAMDANGSGNDNTAIGWASLLRAEGSRNTAVGANALTIAVVGNNLACFGANSGVVSNTVNDDANAIGYGAIVTGNGQTRIGDVWQNHIGGNVGWSNDSDGRFKSDITEEVKGLAFITRLRPVTYNFENRKLQEFLIRNFPDSIKQSYLTGSKLRDVNPVRRTGFIAQEVEAAAKAVGYDFDGVHVPANEDDTYSLVYGQFVVPLVKAVQEQQLIIDNLKKENSEMKARMDAMELKLK